MGCKSTIFLYCSQIPREKVPQPTLPTPSFPPKSRRGMGPGRAWSGVGAAATGRFRPLAAAPPAIQRPVSQIPRRHFGERANGQTGERPNVQAGGRMSGQAGGRAGNVHNLSRESEKRSWAQAKKLITCCPKRRSRTRSRTGARTRARTCRTTGLPSPIP